MRGYSHAITGLAAWGAVASPRMTIGEALPFLQDTAINHLPLTAGTFEVSPITFALGAILIPGAAMINDIDHHNATIAHSLPKIGGIIPSPTQEVARFVGRISGGHRHGTHSILGILIFTLLAYLATFLNIPIGGRDIAVGSGIIALFLTAFTLKVFHVGKSEAWLPRWFISACIAACVTWFFPSEWGVLPLIVGLGAFVHCLGDSLTVGGVPWLWPIKPKSPKAIRGTILGQCWQKNGWLGIPILGTTGSVLESIFIGFVSVYCLLATWVYVAAHFLDF